MAFMYRWLFVGCLAAGMTAAVWAQERPVVGRLEQNTSQHVQAEARRLADEVRRLQQDAASLPDPSGRQIYRQAGACLERIDHLAEMAQTGAPSESLFREFDGMDRNVRELVTAVQALGAPGRFVLPDVPRINQAVHDLHYVLFQRDTTPARAQNVTERQAQLLTMKAQDLMRTAQAALADDLANRATVTDHLRDFAQSAEHFAKGFTREANRRRLKEDFTALNDAWTREIRELRALPPLEYRRLARQAADVDVLMNRLFQRLQLQGERVPLVSLNVPEAVAAGRWFKFVSRDSGKCLEVAGGHQEDGAVVQQGDYTGRFNQQWKLEQIEPRRFLIRSRDTNKCLEVARGSREDGAAVDVREWNRGDEQKWQVTPVGGDLYVIRNVKTNKCLDVAGAAKDSGARVVQWSYTDVPNQQWELIPVR